MTTSFSAAILGHAMTDAGMTPLDGAILEFRDGTQPANTGIAATGTLGATVTFEPTGTQNWATPYGVTVALPSAAVTATGSITPTYARVFQSDHTTVLLDVPAGPSAALVCPAMSPGQRVQLEALVLSDPTFAVTSSTTVTGEVAVGGTVDGVAELPRVYVDTTPPVTTVTKTVGLTGRDYSDLQVAVTAASVSGQSWLIQVDNGYDYTPPGGAGLLLPLKTGTNWVVISAATMPCAAGVRVTPASAASANIPKVRIDNAATGINTTSGSTYYRIQGIEVLPVAVSPPATVVALVNIQPDNGTPGGQGNSYADMPHHIVYDRCYLHGNNGVTQVVRGVGLNGDTCAVIECYIADVIHNSADAQGVGFWMQKGPVRITNTYAEGTGQSILVGGAESRWPGVCVADIEIRYNTLAKNPAWSGVFHDIKTIMEMKAGRRCLIEGNEIKNNWQDAVADWKGACFTFKTVNQDAEATVGHWRNCDIVARHNRIQFVGVGFNYHPLPEGSKPATPAARFTFRNNLVAHIGDAPATTAGTFRYGLITEVGARYTLTDLLIAHNTIVVPGLTGVGLKLGDYGSAANNGGVAARGAVRCTVRDNLFAVGGDFPPVVWGRDSVYVDESIAYYLGSSSAITSNTFSGKTFEASGPPVSARAILNDWLVNVSDGTYPEMHFTNIGGEDYSLVAGSVYSATGAKPATDSTARGVDMTALTAALAGHSLGNVGGGVSAPWFRHHKNTRPR